MVDDECFWGRFVKSKFFFDDKGVVNLEREVHKGASKDESADECESCEDFIPPHGAEEGIEPTKSTEKPKNEKKRETVSRGEDPETFRNSGVFLGFCIFLFVVNSFEFLG